MPYNRIGITDNDVRQFCDGLQRAVSQKVFLRSLRRGLGILARDTNARYRRLHPGHKSQKVVYKRLKGGRWKKSRQSIATVATKRRENLVMVHIMSDYRAKWLEKGTAERHTKGYVKVLGVRRGKGRRTGRIRPEWFFKMSQIATAKKVENRITTEIKKEIKKQVKK